MAHRLAPYLLLVALTAGAFLAALPVPYRLEADTAFQVKSLQQWLLGQSPSPATLRAPDPRDLSRDVFIWSNWWPPAFPFLYVPLTLAGLPLAAALRATSCLLFLTGSLGWLRLAERLAVQRQVLFLYTLSLAAYAITLGGAASLRSTDLLAYAAAPWLAGFALRSRGQEDRSRLFLCGLALGATYWVRYSLFLVAVPSLVYMAAQQRPAGERGLRGLRIYRLAVLTAGFALPVALLMGLTWRQSKSLDETVSGTRSAWTSEDRDAMQPLLLAVSLAGAPGQALFQNDLWTSHLAYFSDSRLPVLRRLDAAGRLMVKSLLGLPATLALFWGIWRARRRPEGAAVPFALLVMAGFYLALTILSVLYRFNYLAGEPRLAAGFMPLLQLLALSGWVSVGASPGRWKPACLLLAAFVAVPVLFAVASFLKNDLYDRFRLEYAASSTGLLIPELSDRDVPAVTAAIRSLVHAPRDLLVLVGAGGSSCAFAPWLEVSTRALPMGPVCAELGASYRETASLRSTRRLTSSQPMRVVLVIPQVLATDGTLPGLEARIPQAREWKAAPMPSHSNILVWFSDLTVPPPEQEPEKEP
jgi:hypothetical protein